jgi:hypothetical protein
VTRSLAIAHAIDHLDSGAFLADLTREVAFRTESQRAGPCPDLRACPEQERVPAANQLGATARVLGNPAAGWPFLIAPRHEAGDLPIVLTYGHADVVIGTLRRELFDRLLIINEHHLRQVLTEYLRHHNTARPHRALGQLAPAQAATRPPEINLARHRIRRKQVLSGLIYEYQIAA